MPATNDPEVRRFRAVAVHRLEDARALSRVGRDNGAIYLAGYAIECALKSLLLIAIPRDARAEAAREFRGNAGHSFDWLKARYFKTGAARFPREIVRAFSLVNALSTDLRYDPRLRSPDEAKLFPENARLIVDWSEGR